MTRLIELAAILLYGALTLVATFMFALHQNAPVAATLAIAGFTATYLFQIGQYFVGDDPLPSFKANTFLFSCIALAWSLPVVSVIFSLARI